MKTPNLEWLRAKSDETITAKRRTWESRCRQYKVQESIGKFSGMGTVYYALFGNEIISKHKKRKPAQDACEKHSSVVR